MSDPNENATNDFDFDLTDGEFCAAASQEANGVMGTPVYDPGNQEGHHFLAPGSPGLDAAVQLPGFNGLVPDMGAFEVGAPPIEFGKTANWTDWSAWLVNQP